MGNDKADEKNKKEEKARALKERTIVGVKAHNNLEYKVPPGRPPGGEGTGPQGEEHRSGGIIQRMSFELFEEKEKEEGETNAWPTARQETRKGMRRMMGETARGKKSREPRKLEI